MSFWFEEDSKGNAIGIKWGRVIAIPLVIIFIAWFSMSSFVAIPTGNRGVLLEFGAVKPIVLSEGIHTVIPFVQNVQLMDVRTHKYEVSATSATKDLLDVTTKVAVNYKINPNKANKIFQTLGLDYEDRLISPAVQETIKAVTAKYDAEELITQRAIVKDNIEKSLEARLRDRDIIIEIISITEFSFPAQFNQAITDKQTAIQLKLKAVNDLERIEVEAKQQIAKSKGESESIKIINEELIKSPHYIQWVATQKWNGIMPLVVGEGMPFINIPINK